MRILTGLIGASLVTGAAWMGGWWFAALFMGITVLAVYEVFGLLKHRGIQSGGWPAYLAAGALVLVPMEPLLGAVALLGLVGVVVAVPIGPQSPAVLPNVAGTVFGMVYPAVFITFLVALRVAPPVPVDSGFLLTMGVIFIIWTSDTFAYYVGRSVGRHKMAPSVSPGKTWEGAAGGLLGALTAGVGFGIWLVPELPIQHWIVVAVIGGVFGPVGDLFESCLKRAAEVKDSANWLPGHGGMLDRFDALFLVTPIVYAYLSWVGGV